MSMLNARCNWPGNRCSPTIKGYFDSIPHQRLMELVRERIADGRVLALIESFLKQGIMEQAGEIEPEDRAEGTPQGGVI